MTDIDRAPEMDVHAATVSDGIVERRADLHMMRFSARSGARLRIALDSLDAVTDVVIMDISSGGISAAVTSDFGVGSQVRLEIPLIGWRDAEVRWLVDGRAGCGFLVPLSEAELLAAVVESPLIHDNFPGLVDQLRGGDIPRGSVPGGTLTPD
jgi:hypothetical protein